MKAFFNSECHDDIDEKGCQSSSRNTFLVGLLVGWIVIFVFLFVFYLISWRSSKDDNKYTNGTMKELILEKNTYCKLHKQKLLDVPLGMYKHKTIEI